jgi:hypothetical protein
MNNNTFIHSDQITSADNDVEIIDFSAEPYQDQRRVKVNFRLSYFQEPPNATLVLRDDDGEEIASVEVVNIIHPENEITLHIPPSQVCQGEYHIEITLFHLEEVAVEGQGDGEAELNTQTLTSRRTTFTFQ